MESDVINSTLFYFGDVTGDIGQSYGQTQNGSRAIGTTFQIAPPDVWLPKTSLARPYKYRDDGDGYRQTQQAEPRVQPQRGLSSAQPNQAALHDNEQIPSRRRHGNQRC